MKFYRLVGSLLVLSLIGRAGDSTAQTVRNAQPNRANAGQAESSGKPIVKLLNAGAEPRTMLRYKFQAGRTENMVMDTSMAMAMEMGDQNMPETKMPLMRTTMTIANKEISRQGDLLYAFKLDKAEVVPEGAANAGMVDMMRQQMNTMVGMTGSAKVTPRGFTEEGDIKLPPGIDPQSRQLLDSMKQSMNQMSAPLPEEAVGKGARWEVTMSMGPSPVKLTQIATYTLKEIQDDKLKLDVTVTQTASPQEMTNMPGVPPGVQIKLESMKTTGKGTVELDLTKVVPTSDMNLTTTNVVSSNGQQVTTTMKMGMKMHPE